ncbi:MAG: hypothetical protein GYA62_01355 [Bacteroidales bacterium]|nr:hypothetical protein [Bacteroidales bacterium]
MEEGIVKGTPIDLTFDGQLFTDSKTGKKSCELSGEECCNTELDGEDVIVVRKCMYKASKIASNIQVGEWKLISKKETINNIICEVYENTISKQRAYVPQNNKNIDYNKKLARCGNNNRYDCYNTGTECTTFKYGDTEYVLVNPNHNFN